MMITVPVQLAESDIEKVDYLVKIGRYKNRSQALKAMLSDRIGQEAQVFEWDIPTDPKKYEKVLKEFIKMPKILFSSKEGKPLVKYLSEERERY
jgi:hypothetical protein